METIISDIVDWEPLIMKFVAEEDTSIKYLNNVKKLLEEWFALYAENPTGDIQPKYWDVRFIKGSIIIAKCEFITENGVKILSEVITNKYPKIKILILGEGSISLPKSDEIIWQRLEKSEIIDSDKTVSVGPCYISVNHVSIGQYFEFLDKTKYKTYVDKNANFIFRGSQIASPGKKAHQWPVSYIAYEDALAFCEWAGCRLPSEVELYRFFQVYFSGNKSFEFTTANWTSTKYNEDEVVLINTPWKKDDILPIQEMLFHLSPNHYDSPFPSFRVCMDVIYN